MVGCVANLAVQARAAAVVTTAEVRRWPWSDLDTGLDQTVLEVPDGERAKSLAEVERLCEAFAEAGLSRDDVVVGLGGGAVTDLAGFAAAVYLRGVRVLHVPTTLLAMVDASVGGKTGVNLRAGKNLVGAFHQPLGVLADTDVLATLPERERRSGLGEVAKCWLLEDRRASELSSASLGDLILLAVRLKAGIVMMDETEIGQRALLNYGHTLGHALEILALERGRDELRHGEAVAGLVGDVRSRADMELAVDTAVRRFGQLDAVVGAAGVLAGGGPVHQVSDEALEAVWTVNVLGVHQLIRAAVPVLQARGAGAHPRIVAVASSAAHQALYHLAAYSAAKQAVVGLVRGTARDLAPYGITANVVSPGSTRTAMLVASAALYGLGDVEEFARHQALGRLLEPAEVAAAIAWLCSPAASGITGADVPVDGGPVG